MTDKNSTIPIFVDMSDDEDDDSMLEQAIVKMIDKALKDRLIELAIDDIQIIAKELMPDFDRMIAEKVKGHFYEIGSFLVGKFGDMEEGE
jgi:hypothetical protein